MQEFYRSIVGGHAKYRESGRLLRKIDILGLWRMLKRDSAWIGSWLTFRLYLPDAILRGLILNGESDFYVDIVNSEQVRDGI